MISAVGRNRYCAGCKFLSSLLPEIKKPPPPATRMRWLHFSCWFPALLHRLDDFDFLLEQAVDQRGQIDPLRVGAGGEPGLHLVIEIDRLLEHGVGAVKLAAHPFGKVVMVFHHVTLN